MFSVARCCGYHQGDARRVVGLDGALRSWGALHPGAQDPIWAPGNETETTGIRRQGPRPIFMLLRALVACKDSV